MRRIICLISVVLVLCACAVPAFALGFAEDGTRVYGYLPFDYYYFSNGAGPMEWPFKCSRFDSHTTFDYGHYDDNSGQWLVMSEGSVDAVSASQSYISGRLTGPMLNGGTRTVISFGMEDEVLYLSSANKVRIWTDFDELGFTNFHVYGTLYYPHVDDLGEVTFRTLSIDYRQNQNTLLYDDLYLDDLIIYALSEDAPDYLNYDYIAVKQLFIEVTVANRTGTDVDTGLSLQYRDDGATTNRKTLQEWFNVVASDLIGDLILEDSNDDLPSADFEVGTFLGDTVNSFLETEIFEGFSFGSLFGIAIALGVLFLVFKMIV